MNSAANYKITEKNPERMKKELATILKKHREETLSFFKELAFISATPLYSSMDIRDSGYKIAPVDDNFFPAGFNNICPDDQRTAPALFRKKLEKEWKTDRPLKKILILPEHHTQNRFYLDNLWHLQEIIRAANFEVQCGWFLDSQTLETASGKPISISKIKIESQTLQVDGFVPDVIVLNNDFSGGYPPELDTVLQPVLPHHHLGWHKRKKSTFFRHYNELVNQFAQKVPIDPWELRIETEEVSGVDFNEGIGLDAVEAAVSRVLSKTKSEYEKRGIHEKPFVFIKSNTGTYGMGIIVVSSVEELRTLNRREKNKMSVGKNRSEIHSVIVQEGIRTTTLVENLSSEPVIYLVGCDLIGGFIRSNTERGNDENLNASGMVFKKLCMSDLRTAWKEADDSEPTSELVYGVVARLAAAASAKEISERNSL